MAAASCRLGVTSAHSGKISSCRACIAPGLDVYKRQVESLEREYEAISLQLEDLRAAGKGKSVRFREQLARKLTVSTMLDTLRRSDSQ